MVSYKVCLVLTVVSVSTNANFHYEHFKTFSFQGASDTLRKPWFFDEYSSPYKGASSDVIPNYHGPYEGASSQSASSLVHHGVPFDSPSEEVLFAASTKKIPREDKNFKKAISPFYTLTDKDDAKYKDIVLKSGVPYCQETKSKRAAAGQKRSRRDAMTCYKCKDPKNGATYEQCSYTLQPQASTRVDDYAEIPSSFRYRRSNANDESQPVTSEAIVSSETKLGEPPFRFSEEYFLPEASHEIPTQYKEQTEHCDKVIKDSMICMVCKDPKTNGKYEQCSYTAQPNEKAYSYAKSSSFGGPRSDGTSSKLSATPIVNKKNYENHESTDSSKPVYSVHHKSPSHYSTGSGSQYTSSYPETDHFERSPVGTENVPQYKSPAVPADSAKQQSGSESVKSGDCKKVTKDSMTCSICKDPKTGGNYEQCSYAYQPSDKVYQYSRSRSFGIPDSKEQKKSSAGYENDKSAEASESEPYKSSGYDDGSAGSGSRYSDYGNPGFSESYYQPEESKSEKSSYYSPQPTENRKSDSYTDPDSSKYIKSESEKISENIKASNCQKVQKDGMTCTVCKDPDTGGNFEQCSYAYQPSDKIFSYSKAKSFGSPTEVEGQPSYGSQGESSQATYQLPDYAESGNYGFATENKPYVATDDVNSETSSPSHHHKSSAISDDADKRQTAETQTPSKVDVEYFDTTKKKAEIEKFLQEFQKEDRSNCKKVMRNQMTCYQCVDDKGFQKEECVFVAAPQAAPTNKVAYHEVKEFKLNPAEEAAKAANTKRETVEPRDEGVPLEPAASASESHANKEELEDERPVEEEQTAEDEEQSKESEPYEYTAETRPRYDKRLGLTLPEYMLTTSEHEAEFDEVVASSRI